MNTTVKFNYEQAKHYATELFSCKDQAYEADRKAEALVILIGIETGLRVSDLLKLRFSDISDDNEYGRPFITTYVSKKKRDEVKPLSANTMRLIEIYNNWCLVNHGEVSEFIFWNYANKKLYSRQWTHKRLNLANDSGELGKKVKIAGAHSLRRTAGAFVFSKTKDLRLAQSLLGHDRIKQTEHYLKLDETEALARLTQLHD